MCTDINDRREMELLLEESNRKLTVDLAARYGGEEFACILPDTDLEGALAVAERIRRRIQDLKIEHRKSPVSEYVTASFGVATVSHSPDLSIEDILSMADKLMYGAKMSGRNAVKYAEAQHVKND